MVELAGYEIEVQDRTLIITKDGVMRCYRVNDNPNAIYKLNKKSITADGGAQGLYGWLARPLEWKGTEENAVKLIINNVQPILTINK